MDEKNSGSHFFHSAKKMLKSVEFRNVFPSLLAAALLLFLLPMFAIPADEKPAASSSSAPNLCQYRYALEFLNAAANDPALDIVLNEPDPDLGLEGETFAAFKFRFLNVKQATRFAAQNTLNAHYGRNAAPELKANMDEDKAFVWEMGKGKGHSLTIGKAGTVPNGISLCGTPVVEQRHSTIAFAFLAVFAVFVLIFGVARLCRGAVSDKFMLK